MFLQNVFNVDISVQKYCYRNVWTWIFRQICPRFAKLIRISTL